MATDVTQRILADPRYHELLHSRGRTRVIFFILAMIIYFGLMLTLVFASDILAKPIAPGMVTTVGIVVAFLVLVSAVVLVGAYVVICDRKFDPLLKAILKDVQ